MDPDFNNLTPEAILQNPFLERVEYLLVDYAFIFAVLGLTDTSRRLMSMLHQHASMTCALSRGRSLYALWATTGQWPEGISDEDKFESSLNAMKNAQDKEWPRFLEPDHHTWDEEGIRQASNPPFPNSYFADAQTGYEAMEKSAGLVKALEISLDITKKAGQPGNENVDNGNSDFPNSAGMFAGQSLGVRSHRLIQQIANRTRANDQIYCLVKSVRLAPLLVDGVFARALGRTREELDSSAGKALSLFEDRLRNGHQRQAFLDGSIHDLLKTCNNNTLKNSDAFYLETGFDKPESLFQEGTSEEDILDLENRLDTKLPRDYKEFLAASNGFGGIWDGFSPSEPLHAIDELKWIDTEEYEYFKLDVDLLSLPYSILRPHGKNHQGIYERILPEIDRVLEIGTHDIDEIWLVPPPLVDKTRTVYNAVFEAADEKHKAIIERAIDNFAGSRENFDKLEWCCLVWSSGGSATMSAFPNFRAYLERRAWESQWRLD